MPTKLQPQILQPKDSLQLEGCEHIRNGALCLTQMKQSLLFLAEKCFLADVTFEVDFTYLIFA